MDIEAAIKYPTNDDDWEKTVLVGGSITAVAAIVGVVGFLITYVLGFVTFGLGLIVGMPLVLAITWGISAVVLGYNVDVMRQTIAGNDRPPRFTDWGRLFKDGLAGLGIVLAYQIPAVVLFGIAIAAMVVVSGAGILTGSDAAAAGASLLGSVLMLAFYAAAFAYSLATTYLAPISIATYAHEGRFSAAFDADVLKSVGLDGTYAVAWLVAVGGTMLAGQVVQLLAIVLIGFFVQFYLYVVVSRLIGEAYAESLGIGAEAGPSPTGSQWKEAADEFAPPGDS